MNARFLSTSITAAAGLAIAAPVFAQTKPAAEIPTILLKVADAFPPTGFVPDRTKNWAEYITKRTDGKVKFQFFWSDSLFKQVDGAEATILLTDSFKHHEVAKFFMATRSGMAVAAPLSINLKRWNGFPDSLKQIFRDAAVQHDMEFARGMIEGEETKLKEQVEKYGMRVVKLSDADTATLEKAGKDTQEAWLADMDKKGVPARASWNAFQDLQRTCEKEVGEKGYPWQKK